MSVCWLVAAVVSVQAGASLDLTIEEAVEIALSRSFQVQRSERNRAIAAERVRSAKAALGPRVDVSVGTDQSQRYYDFQGRYDYSLATPQFSANAGANASYDFDIAGVRARGLRQSRLSQDSAVADSEQTMLNVAMDTRLAYHQALRAQQQVDLDQESVRLIDDLVARVRLRQPGVVEFLTIERSNAALTLEQSRQSFDLSQSALAQQLRLDEEQGIRLEFRPAALPPIPALDWLLRVAETKRADVKQSRIRLAQARLAQTQTTDFRRPSLRVSAFALQTLTGDTLLPRGADLGRAKNAGIGLSFTMPILSYDGGALDAARRIAAIQTEQAAADVEEARERARNELSAELIGLRRARTRIDQAPDIGQAEEALRSAEAQLLSASPKDAPAMLAQVSNARQNWRASMTLKSDAMSAFYGEYFRLMRSLGTDMLDQP